VSVRGVPADKQCHFLEETCFELDLNTREDSAISIRTEDIPGRKMRSDIQEKIRNTLRLI